MIDVVKKMIGLGFNPNMKDLNGQISLHNVNFRDTPEGIIKVLIDAGVDINSKDYYGQTVLHKVVLKHQNYAVNILLSLKADPNIKDINGFSPLYFAPNDDIKKMLFNAGAKE